MLKISHIILGGGSGVLRSSKEELFINQFILHQPTKFCMSFISFKYVLAVENSFKNYCKIVYKIPLVEINPCSYIV